MVGEKCNASVGTFKKGVTGQPAIFSAVIESGEELYQVRRLRDLPGMLRSPKKRVSACAVTIERRGEVALSAGRPRAVSEGSHGASEDFARSIGRERHQSVKTPGQAALSKPIGPPGPFDE